MKYLFTKEKPRGRERKQNVRRNATERRVGERHYKEISDEGRESIASE